MCPLLWVHYKMHSKILPESKMEQIYNDGIEIGELKAKKEMAYLLLEERMSVEQITRLAKVNIKDVQNWIDESVSLVK